MLERQRAGKWSGGVVAHTDYQKRPLEWIVKHLGVPEHTLRWSLNPGYEQHVWDGDKDPLVKIMEALAESKDVGCESATGTGKAQPVDEPILTPNGWVPIGALRPGDRVIGRDGKPTEVLAVYPQGVRRVYRLSFSDGAETRACAEHLWVMQNKKDVNRGCPWRILSTADLLLMGKKTLYNRSLRVPIPEAIELPEANLPVPPYTLGVLLGDGCFRGAYPTLSTADPEILAWVRADLPVGVSAKHGTGYDYRLVTELSGGVVANPVTDALRALGLFGHKSETKFITPVYLLASAPQRLALLQGLLDTDGSVTGRAGDKHIEYCSVSVALADGVVELARSLGGTARCKRSASYLNGARKLDRYRVSVKLPDGIAAFRLRRKADRVAGWSTRALGGPSRILRSVTSDGRAECVCIRVAASDALYVTKDFIVTHNTYVAACLTLWFLACFEDSLVIQAAPKEDQLLLQVWKEIGGLILRFKKHFPQAELLTGKLRMRPAEGEKEKWAAQAFVCGVGANEETAGRAKGFHARDMLIITEETQSIDPAIIASFDHTRTDDHNLHFAVGNPDHQRDQLHQFCVRPNVVDIRISAFDHPNVVSGASIVPGAIGRRRLGERQVECDPPSSRMYLSQLRGVSPAESHETLIRWEWCEAAAKRYNDPAYRVGSLGMGVDVANSEGGDRAAIARGQGACCTEVQAFPCPDASKLGEQVVAEARNPLAPIDPRYVGIDSIGVGASTVNKCRELKFKVRALVGNLKPVPGLDKDLMWSEVTPDGERLKAAGPKVVQAERFDNQKSQALWMLREDLRLDRIALPYNKELFEDLTAWTFETPGRIEVCEKAKVAKILHRSPNMGDAVTIWNFVRRRSWLPRGEGAAATAPTPTKNRDTGLEKLLTVHAKRQKAEEARFKRLFARRVGGRREV